MRLFIQTFKAYQISNTFDILDSLVIPCRPTPGNYLSPSYKDGLRKVETFISWCDSGGWSKDIITQYKLYHV